MRRVIILCAFVSVCAVIGFADQNATTADGKAVVLHDNGAWEYAKPVVPNGVPEIEIGQSGAVLQVLQYRDEIKGSIFVTPDADMLFLAFEVIIDNTNGSQAIEGANIMFDPFILKDKKGYTFKRNIMASDFVQPALSTDDVPPGEKIRGWIVFEVNKSDPVSDLSLQYRAHFKRDLKSPWLNLTGVVKHRD